MSEELKTLKSKVEYILERREETRNSDNALTNYLWFTFYKQYIKQEENELWIKLSDTKNLPSRDDIKRIRAKIQNEEHRFLPTLWAIAEKRQWKRYEWENFLKHKI